MIQKLAPPAGSSNAARAGPEYVYRKGILYPPASQFPLTLEEKAHANGKLAVHSVFRNSGNSTLFSSNFDEQTGHIEKVNGKLMDVTGGSEFVKDVGPVVIFGANWEIFEQIHTVGKKAVWQLKSGPSLSEMISLSSSLYANDYFLGNGCGTTVLYTESDLPPGDAANAIKIREGRSKNKAIDMGMLRLMEEHGLGQSPDSIVSQREIYDAMKNREKWSKLKKQLQSGECVVHWPESKLRNRASDLFRDFLAHPPEEVIVKRIPGKPGRAGEQEKLWRFNKHNEQYGDTYRVGTIDDVCYVRLDRAGEDALLIPIGKVRYDSGKGRLVPGPANCPMLVAVLFDLLDKLGYTHAIIVVKMEELPVVSRAIVLAHNLLRVRMGFHAVGIDEQSLEAVSCGRNGAHAFLKEFALADVNADDLKDIPYTRN